MNNEFSRKEGILYLILYSNLFTLLFFKINLSLFIIYLLICCACLIGRSVKHIRNFQTETYSDDFKYSLI